MKKLSNEEKRAELVGAEKARKKKKMSEEDKKSASKKRNERSKKKRATVKQAVADDYDKYMEAKVDKEEKKKEHKVYRNQQRFTALKNFVSDYDTCEDEKILEILGHIEPLITYLETETQYRLIPRKLFTSNLEALLAGHEEEGGKTRGSAEEFLQSIDIHVREENLLIVNEALSAMKHSVANIIKKRKDRNEKLKKKRDDMEKMKTTNKRKWIKIVGKKRRKAVTRAKQLYRAAESSTCRMMRDSQYKISHFLCRSFVHIGMPNFNSSEIAQLNLTAGVKRRLNMLSFGKLYQRMEEVCELYEGDGKVLRGDESHTTMTCGECFRINEFVGSKKEFICKYKDCQNYSISIPRDGNAAFNIFVKMHLNAEFPPTHECYQKNEYINDIYVR